MIRRVLASLALLATMALPAHADLIFRGEHRAHRREIQRVYRALPDRGSAIDVEVFELPEAEWGLVTSLGGMDGAIGLYQPDRRRMALQAGYEHLGFVFAHEYGHHVYFAALTDAERADWKRFWTANLAAMPRDYARTTEVEGFAECFAVTYYPGRAPWDMRLSPLVKAKIRSYFQTIGSA